jgi:hypothetical protein
MKDLVSLGNLLLTKFMKPNDDSMQHQASEPRCHKI